VAVVMVISKSPATIKPRTRIILGEMLTLRPVRCREISRRKALLSSTEASRDGGRSPVLEVKMKKFESGPRAAKVPPGGQAAGPDNLGGPACLFGSN